MFVSQNSLFSRISRSGCYFALWRLSKQKKSLSPKTRNHPVSRFGHAAPRHFTELTHIQATSVPSLTLSPHVTTPHLPTQPHPTYSSPQPPLAPSSTHYTPLAPFTTHSHPPHGMSATFVKLCSRNIPLRVLRTPVRESAFPECESPTFALYQ